MPTTRVCFQLLFVRETKNQIGMALVVYAIGYVLEVMNPELSAAVPLTTVCQLFAVALSPELSAAVPLATVCQPLAVALSPELSAAVPLATVCQPLAMSLRP